MSILQEDGYGRYEWEIRECSSSTKLSLILKQHHAHFTEFDWMKAIQSQYFTQEMVKTYEKCLPWDQILLLRRFPIELLEKHFGELDLYECSAFQPLTAAFIKKHKDFLSLDIIAKRDDLEKEAREMAEKLYKANDNPEHHRRWDQNLINSPAFCPKNFRGHYTDYLTPAELEALNKPKEEPKVEEKPKDKAKKVKKQKIIDYSAMKKAELKAILEKRKVRVYYHDTMDILIQKCKESEAL